MNIRLEDLLATLRPKGSAGPVVSVVGYAAGAIAVGAVALGAVAVGALAVGRLAIGRASIRRLEIEELVVRKLRVVEEIRTPDQQPAPVSDPGQKK